MSLRLRLTLVVADHVRARGRRLCVRGARERESAAPLARPTRSSCERSTRFTHAAPASSPPARPRRRRWPPVRAAVPRSPTPTRSRRSSTRKGNVVSYIPASPRCRSTPRTDCSRNTVGTRDSATSPSATPRTGCSPSRSRTAGAVQIARSIDADEDILNSLDTRLLLIALAGTIAGRVARVVDRPPHVRPIERLTQTATVRRRHPGPRQPDRP